MTLTKLLALLLAGAGLALGTAALFFVGLFEAPKLMAGWMPGWVADKIGVEGVALLGGTAPACNEGNGANALRRILDRLQGASAYGRRFRLHLLPGDMENAFALPGRHIVLVSGLVKGAKSPEEIAGVLAHEMGHGLEKDPEALFLRNIGMKVIFKVTARDQDSAASFRAMLAGLRYSREAEVKADAHAIAILKRAQVAASPAGAFILRSATQNPTGEGALDDLGTHLPAEERGKLFLSQPPYETKPVLSEDEWRAAKGACEDKAAESGNRAFVSGSE